ncbi:MAG: hypothetical protein K6A44_01405 [bacterium]|nr:hypothetical protein [bacterium]
MRKSKINKLLDLWEKNNLISKEQNANISAFMKERQKETFFRFLKWVSIIGAFWVVGGLIATIINIFELDFMQKIVDFIIKSGTFIIGIINDYIWQPIYNLIYGWFGDNWGYFVWGICCIILFCLFKFLSEKFSVNKDVDKLNLSDEQKNILKTSWIFDVFSAISLAAAFCLFNMLFIPHDSYYSNNKIFPICDVLGCVTFVALAYRYLKPMYLLFGIYFAALSVGMFWGYGYASYWIGASRPVVQIMLSIILLLVGYISEYLTEEDFIKEKFASIYNWTGLFMMFIALWIASFWGFSEDWNWNAGAGELWTANILFILASIGAMYYGAKTEHKLFFNYGLTFLIIETYTIFCSRLWDKMPIGISSLIMGIMLIYTGKILKDLYIKKQAKEIVLKRKE